MSSNPMRNTDFDTPPEWRFQACTRETGGVYVDPRAVNRTPVRPEGPTLTLTAAEIAEEARVQARLLSRIDEEVAAGMMTEETAALLRRAVVNHPVTQ